MDKKQDKEIAKIQNIDISTITRLVASSTRESLELYKANVSHSLSTGFDGNQFVINFIIYPFNNLARVSIRAEINTENMVYKAFRPVTIGIEKNDEWDKLCSNLLAIWRDACIGNNTEYSCDSNEPANTIIATQA
jgi:hypothetical protein